MACPFLLRGDEEAALDESLSAMLGYGSATDTKPTQAIINLDDSSSAKADVNHKTKTAPEEAASEVLC